MTDVAGVGDLQGISHGGADEMEGVAADVNVTQSLRDFGHVAGDALAAGAIWRMVSVCGEGGGMGAVG